MINLLFYASPDSKLRILNYMIFDRWGEKIFESRNFAMNSK